MAETDTVKAPNKKGKIVPLIIVALIAVMLCIIVTAAGVFYAIITNKLATLPAPTYPVTQTPTTTPSVSTVTPTVTSTATPTPTTEISYTVVKKLYSLSCPKSKYTCEIEYPSVSGLSDLTFQIDLNRDIMAEFVKDAQFLSCASVENPSTGDLYDKTTYTVEFKEKNVLSILAKSDNYYGGAHSSHPYNTLNYDMKNQKLLTFSNSFNQSTKDELYNTLKARLNAKYEEFEDAGWFEEIVDSQEFYFTDTGVVFVWNEYEIAPYAMGVLEVRLTYAEVKPFMQSDVYGLF